MAWNGGLDLGLNGSLVLVEVKGAPASHGAPIRGKLKHGHLPFDTYPTLNGPLPGSSPETCDTRLSSSIQSSLANELHEIHQLGLPAGFHVGVCVCVCLKQRNSSLIYLAREGACHLRRWRDASRWWKRRSAVGLRGRPSGATRATCSGSRRSASGVSDVIHPDRASGPRAGKGGRGKGSFSTAQLPLKFVGRDEWTWRAPYPSPFEETWVEGDAGGSVAGGKTHLARLTQKKESAPRAGTEGLMECGPPLFVGGM